MSPNHSKHFFDQEEVAEADPAEAARAPPNGGRAAELIGGDQ